MIWIELCQSIAIELANLEQKNYDTFRKAEFIINLQRMGRDLVVSILWTEIPPETESQIKTLSAIELRWWISEMIQAIEKANTEVLAVTDKLTHPDIPKNKLHIVA